MEYNTRDSIEDNTGDTKTDTPKKVVNLDEVFKREADEHEIETLKRKNEVIERKFEKAEETINSIKTLIKEKSEAEEINKLKVETLEHEVAKLREELSKKEQL